MRKIHRWLSVIFGLLLLWIAATGLLSHGAAIYRDAQAAPPAAAPPAATSASALIPAAQAHDAMPAAAPAAFVCPPDMTCRPKPDPNGAAAWVSFFHHLHAGEEFGVVGTILSIASGLALLFFAFSGLYMYLQMYRRRSHRESHPRKLFW